jgi:DNA primase
MNMDAESIKRSVDILTLIGGMTTLKKVGSTNGGEFCGPCPFCFGTDRFRVQPKHPNGGRYYCRGCGGERWHSVIDFVMTRDGVGFREAMNRLSDKYEIQLNEIVKPVENVNNELDHKKWQVSAYRFFDESVEHLWKPEGKRAREYLNNRGLHDETLIRWMIGFNPQEGYVNPNEWGLPSGEKMFLPRGIVISCFDHNHGVGKVRYLKIRRSSGDPKYYIVKGGNQWLFGGYTYSSADIGFLFESELDVLLSWQIGLNLGFGSLPAGQKLKPEYFEYFKNIADLIVAYDNDEVGDKAAEKLCQRSPRFHKALPLPSGKDLTEYYQKTGDADEVFHWIYRQLDLIPRGKHGKG